VSAISTYVSSRELFANLTLRELRGKYKRSFLGWAWSMINPVSTMIVYTIVFKFFLRVRLDVAEPSGLKIFALFLMTGLLPWLYFQTSVLGSIGSLVSNGPLIKKTYFPRELLPAATVAATLVSHLIEMGLLVVALVAFGDWRAAAFIPVTLALMVFTAIFSLGVGLLLSALNVYFRDIEHFMNILFLVWMYLTPIIYPIYDVPHRFATILKINPMTDMVDCYRAALYNGSWPSGKEFAYFAVWAIAVFAIGLSVFNRLESGLAEEL
jgi:ABC-type polysaccharide/polyol phosphate export permease